MEQETMKLQFICATHRKHLSENPKQAMNSWQKGYDTGLALVDDNLIAEAIPHLGCAYETAEIMLSRGMIDAVAAYENLCYSALLLGENFIKLNHADQALGLYMATSERLEQELRFSLRHQKIIEAHLKTLHKHIEALNLNAPPKLPLSLWLRAAYTPIH